MKKVVKLLLALALVLVPITSTFVSTPVAAQDEKITVYMPSPAGLAEKVAQAFTEETGIQVELFQGTTGEITARIEAEAANPVADVIILASWTDGLRMKAEDKIASYELQAENIVDGWVDEDNTLFGYSASAMGVIYNTDQYSELDADWVDFADEEYKDNIAFPDAEKSGSAKDFLAAYVENNGFDDFEAIAANGLIVPGANKAALESVTVGEVGILIAGVDYNAYKSIDAGEPLQIYYPKGGTIVNPRPAMIMKEAPNPELAQQFIEFLYSDTVQDLVVNAYLLPGRSDIEVSNRAPLDEISQLDIDWEKMMEHADEDAAHMNEIVQ